MTSSSHRLRFSRTRAALAVGATVGLSNSANRGVVLLLLCLAATSVASAQSPYPTTTAPPPAWGGYVLPQPVPYQPTLGTPAGQPASPGAGVARPESSTGVVSALPATPFAETQGVPPPVVIVPTNRPPAALPTYSPVDTACPPDAIYCETVPQPEVQSSLPPGTRNGVFQKIKFTGTWLPRFEDDSLGMTDMQMDVVFGLPFFTRESPLVITPTYAVHYLDGPVLPDLPPRLHDAQIDFENFRRIGDSWILDLGVTVGEYADDHSFGANDALRVTGKGAVVYQSSPAMKWVLGAAYVDRANTEFLPIAGILYTPNDDVEYRLVFPAPKVSWRLPSTAVPGRDERWLYVGGEFGGGVWAVARASGAADTLDVTDWRVFLGVERKIVGGLSRRIEVGYIFGRTLQYASTGADVSLDDTLMLRGGLTY